MFNCSKLQNIGKIMSVSNVARFLLAFAAAFGGASAILITRNMVENDECFKGRHLENITVTASTDSSDQSQVRKTGIRGCPCLGRRCQPNTSDNDGGSPEIAALDDVKEVSVRNDKAKRSFFDAITKFQKCPCKVGGQSNFRSNNDLVKSPPRVCDEIKGVDIGNRNEEKSKHEAGDRIIDDARKCPCDGNVLCETVEFSNSAVEDASNTQKKSCPCDDDGEDQSMSFELSESKDKECCAYHDERKAEDNDNSSIIKSLEEANGLNPVVLNKDEKGKHRSLSNAVHKVLPKLGFHSESENHSHGLLDIKSPSVIDDRGTIFFEKTHEVEADQDEQTTNHE